MSNQDWLAWQKQVIREELREEENEKGLLRVAQPVTIE